MKTRLSEVHKYWFGASMNDLEVIQQQGTLWFGKDDQVDQYIRETFSELILLAGEQKILLTELDPVLQLAVILLLDQFTRNIYRNDPRSFASDDSACRLAKKLLLHSDGFRPIEKVFLYLPLEHSEDIEDQKKSVALYRQLQQEAPDEMQEAFAGFLVYAQRHYEIIARFGRFPHRNAILQRSSTPDELDFLLLPGSSF